MTCGCMHVCMCVVSLVVIMFELTGGLTYIVPIMVAVMISKWVGDALVKDGMYPEKNKQTNNNNNNNLWFLCSHALLKRLGEIITFFFSLTQSFSYDGHIHLLGYPFLDSKEEFTHSTEACDVMHPRGNDPPLSVIDLSTVTVGSLQQLLQDTDYFGFPCVLTASSQHLAGYITRKDVQYVIGKCSIRL